MNRAHSKRLMHGAWILSVAGLIAKVLSAVYRVPYQNLVGNTGFYVYQQIYPLYGIIMTMALTAGPVFVAKVAITSPDLTTRHQTLRRLTGVLAGFGLVIFLGNFAGATTIARWMGDAQLAPLIRVVGCMGLTLPLLAVGRGYFQANYSMVETAWSQVVEQVVRVAVIILVAVVAVRASWSHYRTGTWAMTGGVFGAVAATIIIGGSWLRQRHTPSTGINRVLGHDAGPSWRHLVWQTLTEGGALVLYAAILLILQLVDSFTVAKALVRSGVPVALAENLKGIYDRGQPMVQLGLVIATALTQSLLPP
ncbi:oligosaccharide flippase family protein [Lacticaseibacillus thailandensis]|nr:oligosaccharide flippase family protein [Lacticaseibacillus thailandensis]